MPIVKHLPGLARPRQDVLREYQSETHDRRERIRKHFNLGPGTPGANMFFFNIYGASDPEEMFRWRVKLDCDCIEEILLRGKDKLPTETQWLDYHYAAMPPGQMLCRHDDDPPAPYRTIAEWSDDHRKEIKRPASPVDLPDDHWLREVPEYDDARRNKVWAALRHDEPYTRAIWRVTLSCGHADRVHTNADWKPADGPVRISAKRKREMLAQHNERRASGEAARAGIDEADLDYQRRQIEDGWPMPATEERCYVCPSVRSIVAELPVGWLTGKPPVRVEPGPPPDPRIELEYKLSKAEAAAERLRARIAKLDDAEGN